MINEERLVELFLNLCRINSPSLGEAEIVAWTRRYLENLGLEVFEDEAGKEIGGNANNLIVWLRGSLQDVPKIFFSAHFDTVEPTVGLVIEERDSVFFSASDTILGADDKGGMAPAIEAVNALMDSGEPHGDVCLLLSVAEEIGLQGANALKFEGLDLDFGYVLDTGPPVGAFVTRTATHDKLDIVVHGKPAHAGKDPENGINAIVVAAEAIAGMKMGRIGPETTANLGIIEGGSAVNVVCPSVRIRAEARSTSVPALEAQIDHMVQRFEAAASARGTTVQIDHRRHYASYDISPESEVVKYAIAAGQSLGLNTTAKTTLGGSDANVYNAKGLSSIVLGTGMQHIHTHEEQISRRDLVETARLALQIIREVARVN
jgi:tripeptide aminopeptidase